MTTYPFVAAKWFSPGALIEVRALVLHFAEGGGTVGYFQTTAKDVSAHFVLERTGRIVQMVKDGDADHCQHVSFGSWRYPGELTRANGVAVLGTDVMDHPDHTRVNRYVQAIEIEGFRATGMNPDQAAALKTWVAERRAKYPTIRGLLGHGDIQDKPCPGRLIPWAEIGGHALLQEDPVSTVRTRITEYDPPRQASGTNVVGYLEDGTILRQASWSGLVSGSAVVDRTDNAAPQGAGWLVGASRPYTGYLIPAASLTVAPAPPPPAPDCTDKVAAQREKDRVAALAAIEGVFA